jgi:surfactin synthase thioesterase subunit
MQKIPLVCVPFAGAGASFFHPWGELAGTDLPILALQLPGREWRLIDEPYRDVVSAAADLAPSVADQVGPGGRVALFGHSLGAVLAYEIAQVLVRGGDVGVERLFVSGSPDPWTPRANRASGLADAEFLLRVREFAGYDHEALADPDMRELILPALRADVEMHESYTPGSDLPLPAPITALHARDDALVSSEQTAGWSKATSGPFQLVEVDGGHMYLTEDPAGLLRIVAAGLVHD